MNRCADNRDYTARPEVKSERTEEESYGFFAALIITLISVFSTDAFYTAARIICGIAAVVGSYMYAAALLNGSLHFVKAVIIGALLIGAAVFALRSEE